MDTNFGTNGMFLVKSYRMLQNARITDFTASELLTENKGGGEVGELKFPT